MSLCSLFFFFTLLSSSSSFVSLPWVSRVARSGPVQLRSARPPSLIWILFPHLSSIPSLSLVHFSFLNSLCCWCFLPVFPFPKNTFFPHYQLKSLLFWTEQERQIFPPTVLQHILFFCCDGQSRPAVAKLSFLWSFLFLLLYGSCGACPIVNHQPCEVLSSLLFPSLIPSCPPFTSLIISSWDLSTLHTQLSLTWTTQEERESQAYRCFPQFRGPSHS